MRAPPSARRLALALVLVPLAATVPAAVVPLLQEEHLPDAARGAPSALVPRVESWLGGWLRARGLPAASLAVVLPGGEETLDVACGALGDAAPLEPDARMLSGSVGKTYVAAAALRLAAEARLDLDATAWSVLGEEPGFERLPNARAFTLRQLLRHQSGLPRYVFDGSFWRELLADPDRRWSPMELLAFVFDAEPLFAPGAGWAYSDTNYLVVGMVLERVTGERFYEHVHERFLVPLGLADTVPSDRRRIPGLAQGEVVLGRELGLPARALADGVLVFNTQFEWCGGGWASTARDLARWGRAFFSGAALPAGAAEAMLADPAPAPPLGPGVRYGLGVMLRDGPRGEVRYHHGFMPGYLAAVAWWPEQDLALALQVSSDDLRAAGSLDAALDELAEVVLAG